jgi:large subunit ribosomal protein L22
MKASLSNYQQTPRKTRLVTDLVKGKRVREAILVLSHLDKRAADPVKKLIMSAVANATREGKAEENLVIDSITVDKGIVLRRIMPRARGSASPIKKRRSHLRISLKEVAQKAEKVSRTKKEVAVTTDTE